MDFDSSTKFISSLAKFLQSLCNGYVEFDSGVEVIGHIYLSVDTGKKIDYILNEKVCKTDENSVTFISNSFHAQPAEKPKPPPPKVNKPNSEKDDKAADDDDIILMDEPESTNTGTVPTRDNNHDQNNVPQSNFHSPGASKRPSNQHFSSNRPSKHRRIDSSSVSNPNGASLNSQESNNSSFNHPSEMSNLSAASEPDLSHLSQGDNNSSNIEERDVKPVLDSDMNVVNVKQEYDPSADAQDSSSMYDQQDEGGYYSHDQSYDMGSNQYYGGRRGNEYGEMGASDMYQGGPGDSGGTMMGDSQGQGSDSVLYGRNPDTMYSRRFKCPVPACAQSQRHQSYNTYFFLKAELVRHWREKHEKYTQIFHCPSCDKGSKRRGNLLRHVKFIHGITPDLSQITSDYQVNQEFVEPHPFTLEKALSPSFTL